MLRVAVITLILVAGICLTCPQKSTAGQRHFKFDFGSGPVAPGCTRVLPEDLYQAETGFGFEPGPAIRALDRGGKDPLRRDFCTSDQPFLFSVALPEGNYQLTLLLGDVAGQSTNTIKAELRRLLLEKLTTAKGRVERRVVTVNIRTPRIAGGGEVRLKPRERTTEKAAWDDKLTLEFNGPRPCLCALEIAPADDLPTVYLLGDSTVCDQPLEPWASWGQMLPRFFRPGVVVANHAESGESVKNSIAAGRLDKVLGIIKPGDYLFLQFGHNDMKDRSTNALATYKTNLKRCVESARRKGATPVLVTSMERKQGARSATLGSYPEAMREVARQEKTALIDLNAMSLAFYAALGLERLDLAFQDPTHHNNYGAYQLCQCVVQGIKDNKLRLAKFIVREFKRFDPAHPDPAEQFELASSPGPAGPPPPGD